MAAPSLDTDHPGLRVLAEVATILASGLGSEQALTGIVDALRRGLALRGCRLWLRSADGAGYTAVATQGDAPPAPAAPAAVADWMRAGPQREDTATGVVMRLPLIHEDEPLGLLEVEIPVSRYGSLAHDVVLVVAQILAPVIAATELSQDLASEVALRTREVQAQRNFSARIIDSLPVGLYVIDRGEIQQMETESQVSGDARFYRITKIPMRLEGEDISHVITIGEDVTEWRMAQHRLAQTEKLAAVGQLAAGVMHEINNPLATILACSEALHRQNEDVAKPARQAREEYLEIIEKEVQRCQRIVESLLDFSRPKARDKRPLDVNELLEQTLFLLKHHERFKRLSVERQFGPSLPRVAGDPERLIQSFMALMLNAMDAMNSRGTLTVRSSVNPDRVDEVMIEFIDTGAGIGQEELTKIFEPFYTTKPQGRGTGLGLSICYGIIADHRGRIEVESQVGVGSDFKVYLPVG